MQVETYSLGQLDTNCYLAFDELSLEGIVIDPADDGVFISEQILELQMQPVAFVLTHGHFDHILGLLELKMNFPQVPILMHEADLFLVESVKSRAEHWLKIKVNPAPKPDRFLKDGGVVEFGQEKLTVVEAPGHTPGSICLYDDQRLFSGDVLFKNGIGRTDFSYSDPRQMKKSLEKVRELATSRELLPGHN